MSSLVAGSKISLTSFFTTSSATFSGMTRPNISTNSLLTSGWPSIKGRYIIGRESPYAAKEKPDSDFVAALAVSAATAVCVPKVNASAAMAPTRTPQADFGFHVFIFRFLGDSYRDQPAQPLDQTIGAEGTSRLAASSRYLPSPLE